jgi:PilZ domain
MRRTETVWPLLWDSRMRAPRFRLDLTVRYRAIGDAEWRQAKTGNISSTGVLVRAEDALPLDTRLELRVALSVNEPAARGGEVSCVGRVVRLVGAPDGDRQGFAVAIDEYAFQPHFKFPVA